MKIATADLKQFKANGTAIRKRNIMPILDYIAFRQGAACKNNLISFLSQTIPGADEDLLVDESTLSVFLKNTEAKEIEIYKEGLSVVLNDGKTKIDCPTEDVDLYPRDSQPESDFKIIPAEVSAAISAASDFILPEELTPGPRSVIFVGKDHVCASNGFVAYVEKVGKVEEIVLQRETAKAIFSHGLDVPFAQSASYHFFKDNDKTYGFAKPDYPFADISQFGKHSRDLPSVVMNRRDLLSFNQTCIDSRKAKYFMPARFSLTNQVDLSFLDSDFGIKIDRSIPADGKAPIKFAYNPEYMNIILKSMDDDEVTLHYDKHKIYFSNNDPAKSYLLMEWVD